MILLEPAEEARRKLEYLAGQLADPERSDDHRWMRNLRDDIQRRFPDVHVSFRPTNAETPPSTEKFDPHAALYRG